jgi:hypothetical protein
VVGKDRKPRSPDHPSLMHIQLLLSPRVAQIPSTDSFGNLYVLADLKKKKKEVPT